MAAWIDHPLTQALASALLHFLWQGSVVALLALAWWRIRRPAAPARYVAGVMALATMLAAPVATVAYLTGTSPAGRAPLQATNASGAEEAVPLIQRTVVPAVPVEGGYPAAPDGNSLRGFGPLVILPLWFAGVLVLSGRLFGGWIVARRLTRRQVSPATPELAFLASRMAGRLALHRAVRIVESSAIAVPVMIGWLKPVILVPTAVLAALTPAQVEALLAHELAHVRRHDYLVNLLQSLVETLLFYHPAVWWVSREVRAAREQCCDDLVVTVCDRVTYVTALSDLAGLGARPRVALAATGGPLLERVRRLLGHAQADRPPVGVFVPAVLLVVASTAFLPMMMASPVEGMQVASGIRGGVPGGVRDGVPGGLPGGVSGGVPDGVPTGVPGGVSGGERGGMPEGVPGGTALPQEPEKRRESAETRAAEARRTELLALLERELAAAREYLRQKGGMTQQQLELELKTVKASLEGNMAEQEALLQHRRGELQRVQGQVEVGIGHPSEAARLQNEISVAELRLHVARTEHDARLKQLGLRMEAAKHELEHELRQLAIEHARRRLEIQRALDDGADRVRLGLQSQPGDARTLERLRALERSVQEALSQLAERRGRLTSALEPGLEGSVDADQSQPIVAGDVLGIAIVGEPALPRAYPVGADGTITLPLLGTIEATGRTAAEVRDEIRRLLIEGKLKSDPSVTVQRRHRK